MYVGESESLGEWHITASTPAGQVDITRVRGITTQIKSLSWTDPFGPATASLSFPSLTLLDALGEGDLWWFRPGTDIDVSWSVGAADSPDLLRRSVRWEGYIAGESVSLSDTGGEVSVTCKGALRMAENTVLMPEYPMRPWPFEHAIGHALDRARLANGERFAEMAVEWPSWWDVKYVHDPDAQWYVQPLHVRDGDLWSGQVTRNTGEGEDALSYITDVLTSLEVERGEFTLMLDPGRRPVLRFREHSGSRHTAMIDAVTPGFSYDGSADYEARADVVYGSGRTLTGVSFSNMHIGADGRAFYVPFAHNPRSWPPTQAGSADRLRREIKLTFFEGLSPQQAARQARLYRKRFATAGHVGTVTLTTDPYVLASDGRRLLVPRHTLVAGDRLRVLHYRGVDSGMMFHITEATHDVEVGTTQLQVDSAVRDYVTSDEIRLKGRDSLDTRFSLATGQFNVSVRDKLLPWDENSGYLPKAAKALFDEGAGSAATEQNDYVFPWEEWTTAHPPSDPEWASCYVKIPPATADLATNWNNSGATTPTSEQLQLSQAGSAQLFQVMAVGADGRVMKVPFHVSIYMNTTVTASAMPKLNNRGWVHPLFPAVTEGPYPFFPGAFEQLNEDGTRPVNYQFNVVAEGAGPVASFGGPRAPAGYWPGQAPKDFFTTPEAPTGLLSVEDAFSWDIAGFQTGFAPERNDNTFATAGQFGVMIYCESVWDGDNGELVVRDQPVYFIGRVFRKPPGLA